MLTAKGRLALLMDIGKWLSVVGQIEAVTFVPVDRDIALKSIQLPGEFHVARPASLDLNWSNRPT